jgi:hypothetical protein
MNEVLLAFWPRDLKTVVDVIGTVVTAAAVLVGGLWAYFRFVKDRVYRPRLEVGLFAQWRQVAGTPVLHARLTVKNIGATDVELLQEGTALVVELMDHEQPPPPADVTWTPVHASAILVDHQWIEPHETISDDLLLRLGPTPQPVLLRCVLRWRWTSRTGGIVIVVTRKIIPVESRLDGTEGGSPGDEASSVTH